VFDAELMCVPLQISAVEMYIRLRVSSWARRLWTFQEGCLATMISIQFRDGVRSMADIFKSVMDDSDQDQRALFTRFSFLARTFFSPYLKFEAKPSHMAQFLSAWSQLQWRGTSYQCDEPVCLAGVTNLDPAPILAISRDEPSVRMTQYLTQLEQIPCSLLVQPPPRLPQVGFRWAPTSLLNTFRNSPTVPYRIFPGTGSVQPGGAGLLVESAGIIIHPNGNHPFKWDGESFGIGLEARFFDIDTYQVDFLFSSDQEILRGSTSHRPGNPAIVFLDVTAQGWLGVLGEAPEETMSQERISIGFVAIVLLKHSFQGDVFSCQKIMTHSWLIT
jgi:hypothetical protein